MQYFLLEAVEIKHILTSEAGKNEKFLRVQPAQDMWRF